MWRTEIGERVLKGAEARLLQTALGVLVDEINEEMEGYRDDSSYGIPIFDRLEPRQKLAVLAEVCEHLFRKRGTPPRLTALNESAIAVLYEVVERWVEFEVDTERSLPDLSEDDRYSWRRKLLAAYCECCPDDPEVPDETSCEIEEWNILVDCLTDRVLWDADYLDEDLYVDQAPEMAQFLKDRMSVDDDYFRAVAPAPPDRDLPAIRKRLRALMAD